MTLTDGLDLATKEMVLPQRNSFAKYENYHFPFKRYAYNVKVFFADKRTNGQTNGQTGGTKTICPSLSLRGNRNAVFLVVLSTKYAE